MEDSKRKDKELSDSEQHCIDELEATKWQADLGNRPSTEREAKLDEMQRALASDELCDHDCDAEEGTDPLSLALDEFEAAERNRRSAADSEVSRANAQFVESRELARRELQKFFASRGDYLQPPQNLVVTVQDVRNFIQKRYERTLNIAPIQSGDEPVSAPPAVSGPGAASAETLTRIPVLAIEPAHVRQAQRYQKCLDAGLVMPKDDYSPMPRGIGAVAKLEGIKRQSFTEDVKAHIRRTYMK